MAITTKSNQFNSASIASVTPATTKGDSKVLKSASKETEAASLLEIRLIMRRPPASRGQAFCTLIGQSKPAGNIYRNSIDQSIFLSLEARPITWGEKGAGPVASPAEEDGIARTEIDSYLLTKTTLPKEVEALYNTVKGQTAETQEGLLSLLGASQPANVAAVRELLKTGLEGYSRKKIAGGGMKALLARVFTHQNITFKSSLRGDMVKVADYITDTLQWVDGDDKAKDYTLVLRFALAGNVSAGGELKEKSMGKDQGGWCYPGTTTPIFFQEVSVDLCYMAIEKGAERTKDFSKIVPDSVIEAGIAAALKAADEQGDKPVFMDMSILEARAARVNAWKNNISKETGKKWTNSFKDELIQAAKNQDLDKVQSIITAIREMEGTHPRVEAGTADKWEAVAKKEAEAAPLPVVTPVAAEEPAPATKEEEEVSTTAITNKAVDMGLEIDLSAFAEELENIQIDDVPLSQVEDGEEFVDYESLFN